MSLSAPKKIPWFKAIGPGILVAATGVGAGDLATGAFAGGKLGTAVLWAVVIGSVLKFSLNEGLARWQLATGTTYLEGVVQKLGRPVGWFFVVYLILWSYFVGLALMSACGVAAHAIYPIADEAKQDLITYGLLHSIVAVILVRCGGFRLFERVMSVCIGIMFVTVLAAAIAVKPKLSDIASGLFAPTIPDFSGDGLQWTIALIGGVGGTVTVLCYGYWIRESGRVSTDDLPACRIDLIAGYTMTAVFGMAMVVLGAKVAIDPGAKSASLVVGLANELRNHFGSFGDVMRWAFLLGAWGAVFSSLLGVWQSVPYLFADLIRLLTGRSDRVPHLFADMIRLLTGRSDRVPYLFADMIQLLTGRSTSDGTNNTPIDTNSRTYRWSLYAIAVIPMTGLGQSFGAVQKLYAIIGACFIPLLAVGLMVMNGRRSWIGDEHRNRWRSQIVLTVALAIFAVFGWFEIKKKVLPKPRVRETVPAAALLGERKSDSDKIASPDRVVFRSGTAGTEDLAQLR